MKVGPRKFCAWLGATITYVLLGSICSTNREIIEVLFMCILGATIGYVLIIKEEGGVYRKWVR